MTRIACLVALLAGSGAGVAKADGPAGPDPGSNFPAGPVPSACMSAPNSATCVGSAVSYLDSARANLGQGPYLLPTDFTSLPPEEQGFVLANLDRVLYGLPPVPGITAALSQDAARGVQNDTDPKPSDPSFNYYTSNWAGGFYNMPFAYEAWMYDDGQGSGNLDCTANNSSGCWGHRHDILWRFDGSNPLAMGVSVGIDPSGASGYAMLIGRGDSSYRPTYTYTWDQAVAAGANGGVSGAPPANSGLGSGIGTASPTASPMPAKPGKPVKPYLQTRRPPNRVAGVRIIRIQVHGARVTVRFGGPLDSTLRCALSSRRGRGWAPAHLHSCTRAQVFAHVVRGSYRLRALTQTGSATAYLHVR